MYEHAILFHLRQHWYRPYLSDLSLSLDFPCSLLAALKRCSRAFSEKLDRGTDSLLTGSCEDTADDLHLLRLGVG